MIGLVYIFLAEKGLRDERYGFGFLCLVLWTICIFYAAVAAFRFVLLLVVPVGLAFGVTVSKLYELVQKTAQKYLDKRAAFFTRLALVGLLSLYLYFNIKDVHGELLSAVPQMNDKWYEVLTALNKETPKDAVIDSWWDFGHWFREVAGRRVIFDGMTQNTPAAYWMANVLLSDNEDEAVGILRMINTSDNKAADILEKEEGLDLSHAVVLIKEAAQRNKEEARKYLRAKLSLQKTEELLAYLFPQKLPSVYFIVSYDMPVKVNTISYIGRWDFKNVDLWFKKQSYSKPALIDYAMKTYGLTRGEAESKYLEMLYLDDNERKGWFSHALRYYSDIAAVKQDSKLLYCDNGLVVNLEDHHAFVASEIPERRGTPQSLIFMEDGRLKEVLQKDASLAYSALLIRRGEKYTSLLLDPVLAKSMLARLYYFDGAGLKYFKLFKKKEDENGNRIYVYRIEWPQEEARVATGEK
jgi:hypothetical protein